MEHPTTWLAILAGLMAALAVLVEVGRRLRQRVDRDRPVDTKGLGAVEAAVFSILGLLLAFTFDSAAERFDARRHLVIEEANALTSSYLRFELVPEPARSDLRSRLRAYMDARITGYRALPHHERALAELQRAADMHESIWREAVQACAQAPDSRAAIVLLPQLNAAFDLAATRTAVFFVHPPPLVFVLLAALGLFCAVLAGWSMGASPHRSRLHTAGFVLSLSLTLYLTFDLEYPRAGLVTVESFDRILHAARARMR